MDDVTGLLNERIHSKYVWGDKQADRIKSFSLSWGNLPIYRVNVEKDAVSLQRRINGSRDGWMPFPDGYFAKKTRALTPEESKRLFGFLETVDFSKWHTDEEIKHNIEISAHGFSVKETFQCVFDDGTRFMCATPPQDQFRILVELIKWLFPAEYTDPLSLLGEDFDDYIEVESEYVFLDPNITTILYSDILRLTIESTGKKLEFKKPVVEVGLNSECDFLPGNGSGVAPHQATFFFEKRSWFLRDNYSTNGTWLNGDKMQPGKKYQLAADDEINFAMTEKVTFYKLDNTTQPVEDSSAKAARFLEEWMAIFTKSHYRDETAMKNIVSALTCTPLYFPIEIEPTPQQRSTGPINPAGMRQIPDGAKVSILSYSTPELGDFALMFTSKTESSKCQCTTIARFDPEDYLPELVEMNKNLFVNPFSENRFFLNKRLLKDVLLMHNQLEAICQADLAEDVAGFKEHNEEPDNDYVGKTIAGKYEAFKLISKHDQIATYLVKAPGDAVCEMTVVEKKGQFTKDAFKEIILKEPRMLQGLDHPAIPKIIEIIEDEKSIIIIKEHFEGKTLEQILKANGPLPADMVIGWSKQICNMLAYLHSQTPRLIYVDTKPDNAILTQDGAIKFSHFGCMKTYKANYKYDMISGTKGYAAPEVFGENKFDTRADFFSLGMTMFRLVTGEDPAVEMFEMKPICAINPMLPKGLEYIISKCTQPDPDKRYQSCDELIADLDNYTNLSKPSGMFGKLFGKK